MVVPANLNVQMVSYGTYFLDYGSICQYQTSRRAVGTLGTGLTGLVDVQGSSGRTEATNLTKYKNPFQTLRYFYVLLYFTNDITN